MKTRALMLAAAALLLPLLAAGCGGSDDTNSGSRPSAEEISAGFQKQLPSGTPGIQAMSDCVAKALEQSDLPNGVLRSIAKGESETSIDKDNQDKYTKIITDATQKCVSSAIGSLTTTTGG